MGFTYSVDDHSPHNFGLAFNSRPLRRARFFLVLSRLRACNQAWQALQEGAPSLAILDWMMPGIDGAEVCRRIRAIKTQNPTYVIMLTAKTDKKDVVEGLDAGADDYLTKPFDRQGLRARIAVGIRITELQKSLAGRVVELESALSRVKQLQGLLPICSYCKKIRDDQNYWTQVDNYISKHAEVEFSHSICPTCYDQLIKPQLNSMNRES